MRIIIFNLYLVFFCFNIAFAQLIQRKTYYIPAVQPNFLVWEHQHGTALCFLNDDGVAIGGEILYVTDPYGTQYRLEERQFLLKLDSSLNYQWADTFELFRDYDPDHTVKSVIQLVDSGLVYDTDTSDASRHTVLRKDSAGGGRVWNKLLPSDSLNQITYVTKCIKRNDTLLFSGYAVGANYFSRPMLMGINIAGDTIFYRDYSTYTTSYSGTPSYIYEDLLKNLYLVIKSSNSYYKILQIDNSGNVNSVDSVALQYFSDGAFLFISPTRFLLKDDSHSEFFNLMNFNNAVLDTFNIGCYFTYFSLGKNGEILALGYTYGNLQSPLPEGGGYFFNLDSLGNLQWAIKYNQSDSGDYLRVITAYDDSTFFGTGYNASIPDLILMKFQYPSLNRYLTISSNTICGSDSVLIQAPAGYNYRWSTGDSLQNIYVHQAGSYFVLLSDSLGTFVFSDTVDISVSPLPNIYLGNDTTLCNTQTILLDAGSGFTSYDWQDSSTTQFFLAQDTAALTNDTLIYFVTVSDTNSCTTTDSIQIIFDICTERIEYSHSKSFLSINFNLATQTALISAGPLRGKKYLLKVYDISGQNIFSEEGNLFSQQFSTKLQCENFSDGTYIVSFQTEKEKFVKKFIIE